MSEVITVGNTQLQVVEWQGERVVTLTDIDQVHDRLGGTARKAFNRHRDRFEEGVDFFSVGASTLRTHAPHAVSERYHGDVTLVTEQGYFMLSKALGDDTAWEVQRELINGYFWAKARVDVQAELARTPGAIIELIQGMAENALALEATIEQQRPAVEFQERVATAEGEFSVREAAKLLSVGERWLFEHLAMWGAAYRARGSTKGWLASHAALSTGRLEQRMSSYTGDDGRERVTASVRVTPKGLAWINEKLGIENE